LIWKGLYAPETGVLFISIDDTAEYVDVPAIAAIKREKL
jgi:hypothetical protein